MGERMKRNFLIFSLALPILGLFGLMLYKKEVYEHGRVYRVAIEGYDPRSLISGNYLLFRYKFDIPGLCGKESDNLPAFVCLETMAVTGTEDEACHSTLRGRCEWGSFRTGRERFYIPEEMAPDLERRIREGKAEVDLSLLDGREEVIKDLLIDGKSWRDP